jgi:hypothetical protein
MRLINCTTLELGEFFGSNIPPYAILSHTWGSEEVLFSDLPLRQPSTTAKAGYQKIKFTCDQALRDGLDFAWVDTCCIDKSSSAELSEAINSMFNWYSDSSQCYAFLEDVFASQAELDLPKSRWFTRGWTLQELIAPGKVTFYDGTWTTFGNRQILATTISDITGIDLAVLGDSIINRENPFRRTAYRSESLRAACVAKKMSWASSRVTTRREDIAYCLLGICGINMPLLYGEGDRAFVRLQEEIIRSDSDDSILAWRLSDKATIFSPQELEPVLDEVRYGSLLAESPEVFEGCGELELPRSADVAFSLTNAGIDLRIPTIHMNVSQNISIHGYCLVGLLGCSASAAMGSRVPGIILKPLDRNGDQHSTRYVYRGAAIIGGKVCETIFVSTRDAIRRTESNVTIVRRESYLKSSKNESYLINLPHEFYERSGWRLTDVKGWAQKPYQGRPDHVPRHPEDWDPTTMTYTRLAEEIPLDMLSMGFSFSNEQSPATYTLVIKVESKSVHPQTITDTLIECKDGSHGRLTVEWVDEGTIHHWRVFSINIGIFIDDHNYTRR